MSDDNPTLPYPEPAEEYPTLVIPDGSVEEETAAEESLRRRRWPWVLLVIVVVLALLAVAAELLIRSLLPGVVRSAVIERLQLPAGQQLDVETDGILLPQVIAGRLDTLRLSTDEVTVRGVTGAVDVTATGVPLYGGDLNGATGRMRVGEDQFTALLATADLPVETVAFDAPDATLSGTVGVLGLDVPVAVTVTPDVVDGDLRLTPGSLSVGGLVVDAAQVQSVLGPLGISLTQTQTVCIADRIPAGVTVTGLQIEGPEAVIDAVVDGAIISDASLRAPGVCPRG